MPFYVALYTRMPEGPLDPGEEVSAVGYERARCDLVLSGQQVVNSNPVQFPQASSDWGTVVGFALYNNDQQVLLGGNLSGQIRVLDGTTLSFVPGALSISSESMIPTTQTRAMVEEMLAAAKAPPPPPPPPPKTIWDRLNEDDD